MSVNIAPAIRAASNVLSKDIHKATITIGQAIKILAYAISLTATPNPVIRERGCSDIRKILEDEEVLPRI